jgi:hypothetical protein
MDSKTLIAVSLFLLVLILAVAFAAWRVQRRIAERADAERRMGAALEELQRLTAELRARQAVGGGGEVVTNRGPAGPIGPTTGADGDG